MLSLKKQQPNNQHTQLYTINTKSYVLGDFACIKKYFVLKIGLISVISKKN